MQPTLSMSVTKVPLKDTGFFSETLTDYLSGKSDLTPFYNNPPAPEAFASQIKEKAASFNASQRALLTKVIAEQYESIQAPMQVQDNIKALAKQDTFTVTTGHQLNIFTGPLYFIYKIATTINIARRLKEQYPAYTFVPVYWMASEDHDFAEINHFNLFGQRYQWDSEQKGAVGRFDTSGLEELLSQLPEKAPVFEKAYREQATLAAATRQIVTELFGEWGLVTVDGDHQELKQVLVPVVEDDLANHTAEKLVSKTDAALGQKGYKPQIHAREINFFYIDKGLRERIVKEGYRYQVMNTELSFTATELKTLLENNPERFSPNVVLRPVYQEMLLPNLAYVGGPAEVVYWLQLKDVFDHYKVSFPVLMPRNFALVINKSNNDKLRKLELSLTDVLKGKQVLKEEYMQKVANGNWTIDAQRDAISSMYAELKAKATEIDKSLEGMIGAEEAKALKGLENIEKRFKKSEETKQETGISRITALKDKLFPNEGLQERHDNLLAFYLNEPRFISQLVEAFDPFDFSFYIFAEDEQ
jgi:bacillithiol synthase